MEELSLETLKWKGAIAVLCLTLAIGSIPRLWNRRSQPFDRHLWLSSEPTQRMARYRMTDDLLRRYDCRGWTRQEVENLLGEATQVTPSGFTIAAGVEYRAIDPIRNYTLAFALDSRGKVTSVSLQCRGSRCPNRFTNYELSKLGG